MGHPASINISIFTEMCGSAWRWMEWLCLRLDDSERWSYYKWSSIRRIINFFETLKTVSDIFDWLKGAERLREITPMRSWRNSMAPRCISQERNHSVLSAISVLVWKYFSLWLSGVMWAALCHARVWCLNYRLSLLFSITLFHFCLLFLLPVILSA